MTSFIFYDNKKVQSRKESASGTAREATFEKKKIQNISLADLWAIIALTLSF